MITETVSDLKAAYRQLSAPENDREYVETLQRDLDALDSIDDKEKQLKECLRIRGEALRILPWECIQDRTRRLTAKRG
ncbi:MAG: hypothetical protein GY850_15125 [bacterium]|nr:hypothetical protein [bacterium]